MMPIEKIDKAINLLHDKGICTKNGSLVDFTKVGQNFCINKYGLNWCEIRHGYSLQAPMREDSFDGVNWNSPWNWVHFPQMTETIFRNFCEYFEIEDEIYADEHSVYLTDDDDFVVQIMIDQVQFDYVIKNLSERGFIKKYRDGWLFTEKGDNYTHGRSEDS